MKKQNNARGINVFYGHVSTGLLFMLAGLWGTTQWVAYSLGYQAALGKPYFVIGGYPVYFPWSWWVWAYQYDSYAPVVFDTAFNLTAISFFAMFGVMVVLAIRRAKKKETTGAYGTARWASEKELDKAGLLGAHGVILAQTYDAKFHSAKKIEDGKDKVVWLMDRAGREILRHSGPEHVFCFAPTRSGKGVGLVIPTLLTWTGSTVVYDIKKENWAATAGWRKQFSHCLRFEPTARGSVRFNPLQEIRKGEYEVRDAQNVADILVDPDGSKEQRDHWEKTSHSLLVGVILHVLYAEDDKSLSGVANFLSDPNRDIHETLTYLLSYPHLGDRVHPTIAAHAREMLNKSENELSSVVSTAKSFLSLYHDPIVADNTAVSDFAIEDLMNSERPVSLYLVVPPSDIDRTKPLIRLMLNQMGRRLTERLDYADKHYKHQLLLMLDEFPSLGRLGFFETELAYMAGYGIKCFMIAQSLNQVEKAYGPNNSILDNSHVRITYGALDERTAKRISEMLGQATEVRQQINHAGSRLAPWLGHVMMSQQESGRPLLTPGEILQLPGSDALIMVGGMAPYRARKIMYYQDPRFEGRAWLDVPESEQENRGELSGLYRGENCWMNVDETIDTDEVEEITNRNPCKESSCIVTFPGGDMGTSHTPAENQKEKNLEQVEHELSDERQEIDEKIERENELDSDRESTNERQNEELGKRQQQGREREITRSPAGGDFPL